MVLVSVMLSQGLKAILRPFPHPQRCVESLTISQIKSHVSLVLPPLHPISSGICTNMTVTYFSTSFYFPPAPQGTIFWDQRSSQKRKSLNTLACIISVRTPGVGRQTLKPNTEMCALQGARWLGSESPPLSPQPATAHA